MPFSNCQKGGKKEEGGSGEQSGGQGGAEPLKLQNVEKLNKDSFRSIK